MFEYIKDAGLKPARAYTKRKKTNLIVLHHVQGDLSVQGVHALHLKRGHKGIDYNIYISADGFVYWGRGLEFEGGHTLNSGKSAGVNARSIGIVCNGDFTKNKMPNNQLGALKKVILDVAKKYNISAEQIKAHREVGSTDCPGKYFPLDELKKYVGENLKGGGNVSYQTKEPTPVYKKERTISAGIELKLESYTGGEFALVSNPDTGNTFIVPFENLSQK